MTINHSDDIELTGDESLEELEALLDGMEVDTVATGTVDEPSHDDPQGDKSDVSEGDTDAASPAAGTDDIQEGILAKDGKNVIPYDVLEKERQEAARLREENETLRAQAEEASKLQKLIEKRNEQLAEFGVEPEDLPEDLVLDDAKLEELREDYPEMYAYIAGLNNKIEAALGKQSASEPQGNQAQQPHSDTPTSQGPDPELEIALKGNEDLSEWHRQGGDRWRMAQQVDEVLSSDPKWSNRNYAERFEEVSKRVRLAYGEQPRPSAQEALDAAAKKADQAKGGLPASPSELGNTNRVGDSDLMNRIENATDDEMASLLDGLTEAQMEQVLYNAGF
ncbi:ATPase [Vibrio sp. 2175-1]|uniref:ATPase n=1 Tax=Vibrio TaxID=662 RepID=UPI001CDC2FD1|nr:MULTISPECIES: ATPase [Vibrio]MCA2497784.1 ATPase [Vibrio alginolyticus]MDW2217471.1 ATPase [Vibrio sp. 2175-1]